MRTYQILILATILAISFAADPQIDTTAKAADSSNDALKQDQSCLNNHYMQYFWDGQKCEICMAWCNMCTEYNGCTTCRDGYSLNKDDTSQTTCTKCQDNYAKECCFTVPEVAKFSTTKSDLYTKASRTTKCLDPTLDTSSTAIQNYKLAGSVCLLLSNCIAYSDFGKCVTCRSGYYVNQKEECEQCANSGTYDNLQGCAKCVGKYQCTECNPGWYIASNGLEESAKVNSGDKGGTTQSSDKTDHIASNCHKCNGGCLCSTWKDLCTSCQDNTYRWTPTATQGTFPSGTCPLCSAAIANCAQCSKAKSGTTQNDDCTKCASTHALKQNTATTPTSYSCEPCPANCIECTFTTIGANSGTSCTAGKCKNGFREKKDANNFVTCVACALTNALRCNSDGNGDEVITQCKGANDLVSSVHTAIPHASVYYLINDGSTTPKKTCQLNSLNCMKMTDGQAGKCDTCYPNYFKLKTTQECKACTLLTNGCASCKLATDENSLVCGSCTAIQDSIFATDLKHYDKVASNTDAWTTFVSANAVQNYSYDQASSSCKAIQKTSSYCMAASADGTKCKTCQVGFRLPPDVTEGDCTPCTNTYCIKCSITGTAAEVCTMCAAGFRLFKYKASTTATTDSLKCERCIQNCLRCETSRDICTACNYGYYVSEGVCKKVRDGCLAYADDGTCSLCEWSFRVVDGYCLRCIDQGNANTIGSSIVENRQGFIKCYDGCTANLVTNHVTELGNSTDSTPIPVNGTSTTPSTCTVTKKGASYMTVSIIAIISAIFAIFI